MTYPLKLGALFLPIVAPFFLSACVSQDQYDAVVTQNQQLLTQLTASQAHVIRLQGAIKYTVNADLPFPSGSWQMSADGKDIIAKMAKTLAPGQQDKLLVNGYTDNAPSGPDLKRMGVTSSDVLSQKRAESAMQYMISQGVKPDMVAAKGYGEANEVAPNTNPKGRAQNRRVEVTLTVS